MANPTPFKPTVRQVSDGQPVNAAFTNRGPADLEQRTRHLKERLDEIMAGQALVLIEQAMAPNVLPGTPVYLDNDLVWKPCKAALDSNDYGVPTGLAKTAFVGGLVLYKDTPAMGGVVLYGHVEFTADILNVIQGTYVPGAFCLSGAEGMLTGTRPSVPVGVCVIRGPDANGVYRVFVNPENKSVIEDHVHYKLPLEWRPAGVASCLTGLDPDERYTIIPDSTQKGWLPTDDPVFANMVKPVGAHFGYNIAADETLQRVWPPIPLSSVHVERGDECVSENGRLVANEFTLWWMDDCYGGAPWLDSFPCLAPESSEAPEGSSSAVPDTCFETGHKLTLWMVRMTYKTSDAMVTSLEPANSTIELVDCEGNPATAGRLRIRARFSTTEEAGSYAGTALKAFDPELLKFTTGAVISRVRTLSPHILISGTAAGDGWKSGDVSLDFSDPSSQREGQPSLISLKNVRETSYNDIMYLAFDPGVASHIIGKIDMGKNTLTAQGTLQLHFWLLAKTAGTLPAFTLSVIRVPMPDDCTPQDFPSGAWSALPLIGCGNALLANQYVQVTSDGVTVQPGDLLLFKLARANSDAYAGEVGLPSIRYVITV